MIRMKLGVWYDLSLQILRFQFLAYEYLSMALSLCSQVEK